MRKKIRQTVVGVLGMLCLAAGLHAAELAGVRVDETVRLENGELRLNGAGLRSKLFIKVYVGALHVDQKSTEADTILNGSGPRRMTLYMLRDMDAESLQSALDEGLKSNHAADRMAEIQPQADALGRIMRGIGKVREGDRIAIDFSAEGVTVALNGETRGKVAGPGFAKALLKVWLGEKPADNALKKALLGR